MRKITTKVTFGFAQWQNLFTKLLFVKILIKNLCFLDETKYSDLAIIKLNHRKPPYFYT